MNYYNEEEIDFIEELKWRGMIHTIMPGTENLLKNNNIAGYIGFDPTSDSLHVGSLAQIITLIHFQKAGHKPIILVGGATGAVGDPSGKSLERKLLSPNELAYNLNCIQTQLEFFLDFDSYIPNRAEVVNNFDWFQNFSFLEFIRDVGKHITVNYMMAKDSVKNRINGDDGMSFTEFSYQLVQGFDFYYLWKHKNCSLQMGGSDQWGNIVTGTELIRKKDGGEAFAITTNLITKSDGSKFGKSEGGNIWLNASKTSPLQFYRFWRNCTDEDAKKFIKIFTFFNKNKIEDLIVEHNSFPHLWKLQKTLAESVTELVHGADALQQVLLAENFKTDPNYTWDNIFILSEDSFLKMFISNENSIKASVFFAGQGFDFLTNDIITFLFELKSYDSEINSFEKMFESKGEIKRLILNGGISINKFKIRLDSVLSDFKFFLNKYLYVQKGKNQSVIIDFCDDVQYEIERIKFLLNNK